MRAGDPTGIAATQGKAARAPQPAQIPRQTVRRILRRRPSANRNGDPTQTADDNATQIGAATGHKRGRRPMQAEDDDTAQGGTAARHKARAATRHKRGRRPMQTEDDDAA